MSNCKTLSCSCCGRPTRVGVEAVACTCCVCVDRAVRANPVAEEKNVIRSRRPKLATHCQKCGREISVGAPSVCPLCQAGPARNVASLIRGECANYVAGGCLKRTDGVCLVLGEPTQRCEYFESAVLPLAVQDTTRGYYRRYGVIWDWDEEKPGRRCPDCGEALPPRKKFCAKCSVKHRHEASRKRRRGNQGENGTSASSEHP